MARIEIPEGDDLERLRMWGMVPEMNDAIAAFRDAVYVSSSLAPREREVARMRIAQINDCHI